MRNLPIAIQLYSVREALKENFKDTMKKIADLGYDGVEFAWEFGGMEPEEVAEFMKSIGLRTASVHTKNALSTDPANPDLAYAKALGADTLICSGSKAIFVDQLQEMKKWARETKRTIEGQGLNFAYHNHSFEFAVKLPDGRYPYEEFVGDDLSVELDVYWLANAGVDPVEYVKRFAKRLPRLHLKDRDPETGTFIELGCGNVPLVDCVDALAGGNCRWLVYEQDKCSRPVLESAEISIRNLKRLLGRD